jgi:hypothetical protein
MPLCNHPAPHGAHPAGLACLLPTGHPGLHAAELAWFGDALDTWMAIEPAPGNPARFPHDDEAPTMRLPPVRDSIGPRRQPPAFRSLPPGSAELLHLIADALAADEDQDGPTL